MKLNLKINHHHIYIAVFTLFFFIWSVSLNELNDLFKIIDQPFSALTSLIFNKIKLSYLILLLLIPIFYGFIKKRDFHLKEIFNNQKYIIFFVLFVFAHYIFIKFYYNETIAKSEIFNLIYLLLLTIIYCHYRNFIFTNFKKIITFYLIIFIGSSIYDGQVQYNLGQCNADLFLIDIIRTYLKINLTNGFYLENSHLAVMSIAVLFSSIHILVQDKKINILFLLLFLTEVLVVLNNLSTTYFVCYFITQIFLLFFFLRKINIKFWIFTILLLSINSYLFFSDKNCTVKVTDFKVKEVLEENLEQNETNLTTLIYKRSVIIALNTLKNRSLGWGIDGMDNATHDLMSNYNTNPECDPSSVGYEDKIIKDGICNDPNSFDRNGERKKFSTWTIKLLNTKDGLSNIFKMFTEFGIFTFIILFYFIKYIRNIQNIQNINPYNLFIIVLFITMCIRGVGYFNGGFIFCLLEFMYCKNSFDEYDNVLKNR